MINCEHDLMQYMCFGKRIRDSSVSTVTKLRIVRLMYSILGPNKMLFPFSEGSRRIMGPTEPPVHYPLQ